MPEMPSGQPPLVSVVVVTFNALEYVRRCLEGVLSVRDTPIELIVVDNASEADTREYLQGLAGIRLIQNEENRLWCAGANQGMRAADPRSRHLLLLNSDCEFVRPDWLQILLKVMESGPRVGMVGPRHNKIPLAPTYGWIDGQCLLIRREVAEEVGYFDEERWPWGGAPMEFTAAAYSRGWIYKVVHPADGFLVHHVERSKTPEIRRRLESLPRPQPHLREIMRRHGLKPQFNPLDHPASPKFLRGWLQRRRFYYTPPVASPAP